MIDLSAYFGTVGAMIPTIIAATAFVNRFAKLKGFPAQILTWVIAVVAAFVGYYTGWSPFLAGLPVYAVAILGVLFGLGANGFFKIPLVKWVVDAITDIQKKG